MVMKKVTVLMSAYNGELYIKDQLKTLVNQKNVDLRILVRDDGSQDHTVEIIKAYEKKYPYIRLIEGTHKGAMESFLELMWICEPDADYYAFCDQDDIWLEDKLSHGICYLNRHSQNKIRMYCSSVILVDENLRTIQSGTGGYAGLSYGNALVENRCIGCTIIFSADTLLQIRKYRRPVHMYMHDWFLYLFVSAFGEVICDRNSYILYRQHKGNLLGGYLSDLHIFRRRIRNMKNLRIYLQKQIREFVDIYPVGSHERKLAGMITDRSFANKAALLASREICRGNRTETLVYKLFVLIMCNTDLKYQTTYRGNNRRNTG